MPPREMPPARTVTVPGRGEFFLRDTRRRRAAGDAAARVDGQRRPNWHVALRRRCARPATECSRSTIAATAAGCGRWSRSGWPTAPRTPPGSSDARARSGDRRRLLDGRRDRAAGRPRPPRRRPRDRAQRHRPALAGPRDPACVEVDGRRRPRASDSRREHIFGEPGFDAPASPRLAAGRVASVRDAAQQRQGHGRGGSRVGAVRLAAVAAVDSGPGGDGPDEPRRRGLAGASSASLRRDPARPCSRSRSTTCELTHQAGSVQPGAAVGARGGRGRPVAGAGLTDRGPSGIS